MTTLYEAVANYDVDRCLMELNAGADPNVRNQDGYTPLHRVVQFCVWPREYDPPKEQCLKLLLEWGADVNAQDYEGLTPLHHASRRNNTECVKMLLRHGADHKIQDYKGKTPLHWASIWGFSDNVRTLLKAGADTKIQDYKMKTPKDRSRRPDIEQIFKDHEFTVTLYIVLDDIPPYSLSGSIEPPPVFFDEASAVEEIESTIQEASDMWDHEWIRESTYMWTLDDYHMWITPVTMNASLNKIYIVLCDGYDVLVGVASDREGALKEVESWLTDEGQIYVYTPEHKWKYGSHNIWIAEAVITGNEETEETE
jgi:hypothetical protein